MSRREIAEAAEDEESDVSEAIVLLPKHRPRRRRFPPLLGRVHEQRPLPRCDVAGQGRNRTGHALAVDLDGHEHIADLDRGQDLGLHRSRMPQI